MKPSRKAVKVQAVDILHGCDLASLRQMGLQLGVDTTRLAKPALVALLAQKLYDPKVIARSLAQLDPVERYALDCLVLRGGIAATNTLWQQLEAEGHVKPRFGWGRQGVKVGAGSRTFESLVARLGAQGLVFSRDSADQGRPLDISHTAPYLFIPDAILRQLPPVSLPVETAPAPASERQASPDALVRDAHTFASLAHDRPIPLITGHQIAKRALVEIDDALRVPEGARKARSEAELGRLPFLRALLEQVGVVVPGAAGLHLGPQAEKFLSRPRGARHRLLYDAYRTSVRWSELSRLSGIVMRPRLTNYGPGLPTARQAVLAELGVLPAGEWIAIAHLVDRMWRRAPDFLLPWNQSSKYYGWSYHSQGSPYQGYNPFGLTFEGITDDRSGWEKLEGGFIRVVVVEALCWLGMVDLGAAGEQGPPSVFRINEIGSALLRGETPPSNDEQASNVVIQPNFQILALDPTDENILFTLDRMARRVRSGQVAEYLLSRESVYAAQHAGMDVTSILGFLERISSTPIPQNVRRSLEDWGAQHQRIVLRRGAALVQAVDERALDALYADPALSGLLGRRLAPTAALIPLANLEAVYEYLVTDGPAHGLTLPALSEGYHARPVPSVTVDATGQITLRDPVPDLYLVYELRRLADDEPGGTFRLTPASLQRAARAGGTPQDVISFLELYHEGPLPQTVVELVRRWTRSWGHGALVEGALLQVESRQILDELLADEDLASYIHPLPGVETLATVQSADVEPVRALLSERGMELEGRLRP